MKDTEVNEFSRKRLIVGLHISLWIIIFIVPSYLYYSDPDADTSLLIRSYLQFLLFALIFYLNYLLFTPYLFHRGRKILYFVSALVTIGVATVIQESVFRISEPGRMPEPGIINRFEPQPPPDLNIEPGSQFPFRPRHPNKHWPIYNFIITTLFISGFGMGLSFIDRLTKHERERKESEKEKLNAELAFLKNQINPHFFFNTLNNIYSLVQTDVKDGQTAILQLSKLMRYLLYDTVAGEKHLSEEIEFMKTYLELMKLRLSEKVTLSVSFPDELPEVSLPPLLFLPFVENSFKHGISYRRPSFIDISLRIEKSKIVFECSNSIGAIENELFRSGAHVGLENVKKRLALLYPGRHSLIITESENSYSVLLTIDMI